MNLKDKRSRRIAAACASAVAVTAGGVTLGASLAGAAGGLTVSAGSSTKFTTLDFGAVAATEGTGEDLAQPLSDATFAARVTSALTAGLSLSLDSYTAPTGQTRDDLETEIGATASVLWAEKTAGGSTGPTAGGDTVNGYWHFLAAPAANATSSTTATLTGNSTTATKDVFLTANAPGTYTFHFVDPGASVGTDDDVLSDTFTMTVLDAEGATAASADDWSPTPTVSATSLDIGAPLTGSVSLSNLARVDTRGSSSSIGTLASKLSKLIALDFTSTTGALNGDLGANAADGHAANSPFAITPDVTSGSRAVPAAVTAHAGTVKTTAYFDRNGNAAFAVGEKSSVTGSTTLNPTDVATTTLADVDSTGAVTHTGAAVAVKTGTSTVTYTATVKDASVPAKPVSGASVYFTLTPVTNAPTFTTDGALVSKVGTTMIYQATSDASGVARLKVTSNPTTAGTRYTVDAVSNGAIGATLTATYTKPSPSKIEITNTAAELHPPVTQANVTLKGRLLDQFGQSIQPDSATASQQVTVGIGASTAYAQVSNGSFSYLYTPASTPSPGDTKAFTFDYDEDGAGAIAALATASGTVSWATSAYASVVTLNSPVKNATHQTVAPHDDTTVSHAVSGVVKDTNGTGLPYKIVTLTGTPQVLFSTAGDGSKPLVSSLQVPADGSGSFSAFVYYTKTGTDTVTATADGASDHADVTTDDSIDPYKVTVDDQMGTPGATVIVTGKVLDMWDNPVPNNKVDLSLSNPIGVLGATTVTTDSGGAFSTTLATGANSSGTAYVTATLWTHAGVKMTSSAGLNADLWTDANGPALTGLVDGKYQSAGKVTIQTPAPDSISIIGSKSVTGGGYAQIQGTTKAKGVVTVLKKTRSGLAEVSALTADDHGHFSTDVWVDQTTTFIAKLGTTAVSNEWTVKSYSTVKITGTSKAKKNRISINASGAPLRGGSFTLWQKVHGHYKAILTVRVKGSTVSFRVTPTKSRQYFAVTYKSPGSYGSAAATISVKR